MADTTTAYVFSMHLHFDGALIQEEVAKQVTSGRRPTRPAAEHPVNTGFILYPELLSIARKSFAIVEPLKEALAPFAELITSAFVFGSVAKGTDSGRSDIDLIVVGSAPLLELSEVLHLAEQGLVRPVNFSLNEPAEWAALIETDPVMAQIAQGPTLKIV